MKDEKLRASLDNYAGGMDQSILLYDSPAFDKSFLGVTDDGRAVYDYDSMVSELAKDDEIPEDEAIDFIETNTMCYHNSAIEHQLPIVIVASREQITELY